MFTNHKIALLILDGWGHGKLDASNAIFQANTPFVDSLYKNYPNTELITHGEQVGLPAGQMGNSEVGHLNIGAGRIVYQELLRINKAIVKGELAKNETLQAAINYAKTNNKAIHLMGLLSDGGVHAHLNHIKGLCSILQDNDMEQVFIHAFTDGRDTDPKGGVGYLTDLQTHLAKTTGQISSVIGRYYAMDRDKRWERIKLAYDLLLTGKGKTTTNVIDSVAASYQEGVTDEFIQPIIQVDEAGKPIATIQEDEVVICFNFRTDRCRQITEVLTQTDMPEQGMTTLPLHYVTMTKYDETFTDIPVLFDKKPLVNTLGAVLEKAGKTQVRIAETEKYPHVTFFFSGGQEVPFKGESRIMIPSPKVATYDLQPEMSAKEITASILPVLQEQSADFICLNFANTDMVGHTGVLEAAIKAAETVDNCTKQIVNTALANDYALIIIADHGNADFIVNADGSPNTAHTTNLVPMFLVANDLPKDLVLKRGKLGDIAPTILQMMDIDTPKEMNGISLM